jgi:tetratricopeptide (TPR) repeat protein
MLLEWIEAGSAKHEETMTVPILPTPGFLLQAITKQHKPCWHTIVKSDKAKYIKNIKLNTMKSTISTTIKFLLIILAIQFAFSPKLTAQTDDDYFLLEQGNKAYTEGNFEQAVEIYQKLVNAGYSAGELYYNLGNAYYRIGDYKSAILNYERAKLLMPDNENVLTNLEYSQRFVQDKIETVPKFFLVEWAHSFIEMFTEKAWAIISIICFMLFLAGVITFLFTKVLMLRKLSFYVGILAIFISILAFYSAGKQKQKITQHNTAIVFSPAVTVKSAPNENGTDLFIIHEGLKVTIISRSNGWKEIKLSDGKVGWLPDDSVVEI